MPFTSTPERQPFPVMSFNILPWWLRPFYSLTKKSGRTGKPFFRFGSKHLHLHPPLQCLPKNWRTGTDRMFIRITATATNTAKVRDHPFSPDTPASQLPAPFLLRWFIPITTAIQDGYRLCGRELLISGTYRPDTRKGRKTLLDRCNYRLCCRRISWHSHAFPAQKIF